MFSSCVLALWVYFRRNTKGSFIKFIFSKKIWFSKSAFLDYSFVFFNAFVKVVVLAPIFAFGLLLAQYTEKLLVVIFDQPSFLLNEIESIIIYTVTIFLINDFSSFLVHYFMHKIPLLWRFHKIHHSATTLNPVTQYRIHPVELIINNFRGLFVNSITTGVFIYFSENSVYLITFFGVNILTFVFLFYGSNLRHSHVKLVYWNWLESIIISPYQHQIHHSNKPMHYNKNLGSKLAIWDWLFGTLVKSKSAQKIIFGLGEEDQIYDTFFKNLITPFRTKDAFLKKNT